MSVFSSLAPWREIIYLTQRYWVVEYSYTLQLSKLKKFYSEVNKNMVYFLFSHLAMSDSLQPHGLQHASFSVFPYFRSSLILMFIESMMASRHLILFCLLLLPSVFLNSESALHIRWPKDWHCRISISPSSEYSGLTSLRIDWFDFLAVQGTLKSSLAPQFKSINFGGCSSRLRLPWNSHNNLFPK